MGLRFRRSIRIARGVRLNLGKTGASLSLGGRGGRVTVGTRRTTISAGLPGSGYSYSTSYSNNARSRAAEARREEKQRRIRSAEVSLQEKREEYEKFTRVASLSPRMRMAKYWHAELAPRSFVPEEYEVLEPSRDRHLEKRLEEFNDEFKSTGAYWVRLFSAPFIPLLYFTNNPILLGSGVCGSLGLTIGLYVCWKWKSQNRLRYNELAESDFEAETKAFEELKSSHPANDAIRIEELKQLYSAQPQILEPLIEECLSELEEDLISQEHSYEIKGSFEVSANGRIFLDLDLPEIEDVVETESSRVLKSGEISTRAKAQKTVKEEYAQGAVGLSFFVAAHLFNLSPGIEEIILSAYTQRASKTTGNESDDYVYSVRFNRVQFTALNLKSLDPVEAIKAFPSEIEITKSFDFKSVVPYERAV